MIYTVTMNPAIDCAISAEEIIPGRVNRADSETVRFGGKGINVSYVLKNFSSDSILTGFVAGFTGDALAAGLTAEGFSCDFVKLSRGMTRINVKLTSSLTDGDPDTEINAPGPSPTRDDLDALLKKLSSLTAGDAVVLAGSMPAGVSHNYVNDLADALPGGASFICDLSGEALRAALTSHPDFVKPNIHELYDLLGISATAENLADHGLIADSAAKFISMGAKNALVTMGSSGAYYITADGDSGYVSAPPSLDTDGVRSAVGCGDSAVAGWLIGMGYAGDTVRDLVFTAAGIDPASGKAEAASRLAVTLGSTSYYCGFPASPKKILDLYGT